MKTNDKNRLIPLVNNRGQIIWLAADTTIDDLVRQRIRFEMVRNGVKLPDNWYASQEEEKV